MEKNNIKTLSLQELLSPLKRNWGIVILAFSCVLLTVMALTFTQEPVYEASASVAIREDSELQSRLFDVPAILAQSYLINNQVAYLQSRSMAGRVIEELMQLPQKDSLLIFGYEPDQKSLSIKEKILEKLNITKERNEGVSFSESVYTFQKNSRVLSSQDSDILQMRVRSSSSEEAALLVNTWVNTYKEYSRSETRESLSQTKLFLETKLADVKNNLENAQKKMANYKKDVGVVSLDDETYRLIEQEALIQVSYDESKTELESVEQQLGFLREQLDESRNAILDTMLTVSSPALRDLQERLAALEGEKASMASQLLLQGVNPEEHNQIRQINHRIAALRKTYLDETSKLITRGINQLNPLDRSETIITRILELETDHIALKAKIAAQEKILNNYRNRRSLIPDKSLKLADLEHNVQVYGNLYNSLRNNVEEVKIQEAGQLGIVRVVDLAEPPGKPVLPQTSKNIIIGVFFGILLGIGLAFSRDYFVDTINNSRDMEEFGVKVMGSVPRYKKHKHRYLNRKNKKDWAIIRAKAIFPYLLSHNDAYSTVAESYRAIRTSLYFSNQHKNWKTILVTSSGPNEGKSTTAANLAITIAQKGVNTLLIDSDLRRPVMDMLFMGNQRNKGLTNVLMRESKWQMLIRETSVKKLFLMCAGPAVKNSSELISSKYMPQILKEMGQLFQVIILDSPPLLAVTDATVLASLCDGVIFVARAGHTKKTEIIRSLEILEDVNAYLFGSVITDVSEYDQYGYKSDYMSYLDLMPSNEER